MVFTITICPGLTRSSGTSNLRGWGISVDPAPRLEDTSHRGHVHPGSWTARDPVIFRPALAEGIPCGDCESCIVRCKMGFNVKDKIGDIARLGQVPDEFLA